MATQLACPTCGTPMREIVWGYGTIADVADAGDAVIGGCVIDVDGAGRVAALQCPACGTRTDAQGVALERRQPPATAEHPFAVAFSNPLPSEGEVTMQDETQPGGGRETDGADASPYVDDDFGGIASGGDWKEHVEPYGSREDALPESPPAPPERVEPYASREDEVPEPSAPAAERVEPYASREDAVPAGSAPAPERVEPYESREDALPETGGEWREHIDPYDAAPGVAAPAGGAAVPGEGVPGEPVPGEQAADAAPGERVPGEQDAADAAPGERIDAHSLDTSDFTDAEEEGWPAPRER